MPPNISPTLDVDSCKDMLEKLVRERSRIDSARGDREALSDHGINFAVTAWHLTEWVWRDMKNMRHLKAKLAKVLGVPVQRFGLDDFQRYVCAQCPDLTFCQAIATASKHVGADRKLLGQGNYPNDIRSEFSATAATSLSIGDGWVLKIVDGENRLSATSIFLAVQSFWDQFIYSNGICGSTPTQEELDIIESLPLDGPPKVRLQ